LLVVGCRTESRARRPRHHESPSPARLKSQAGDPPPPRLRRVKPGLPEKHVIHTIAPVLKHPCYSIRGIIPVMDAAKVKTALSAIPEALERQRKDLGISREKYAVLVLNISCSTYQRWLGGRFNPDLETLQRLMEILADSDDIMVPLTAQANPVLAELWDNPEDAVYDVL